MEDYLVGEKDKYKVNQDGRGDQGRTEMLFFLIKKKRKTAFHMSLLLF